MESSLLSPAPQEPRNGQPEPRLLPPTPKLSRNPHPRDSYAATDTAAAERQPVIDATTLAQALGRKEFKIFGQVGNPGQGEKLGYQSLTRQIEDGISKNYSEREVVSAVVRSVSHGMPLKGYLESKLDLTLPKLRRILRCHFQEQDVITAYQELTSAMQGRRESPQDFAMRVMNLRQKVVFASKEEFAALRYDADTMNRTFLQTLNTGLEEGVRHEIRKLLEDPHASDEDLLEGINVAMVLTSKRKEKQVKNSTTSAVRIEEAQPTEISLLAQGLANLQATVASLQETITSHKSHTLGKEEARPPTSQRPRRERGCEPCREAGRGDDCSHCYRCGGENHIARGCSFKRQGNGRQATGRDGR